MEGASSGLAEHLDNILPVEVQFVLGWNPPQLIVGQDSEARARPNTHTIGYTRPAAFYDKHLASHLTLEHVVCLDTLVSTMANTVDQAIRDAVAKRPLPEDIGILLSAKTIKHQVKSFFRRTKKHETGVAEAYSKHAATYCLPIASTLAIHPSSEVWDSILNWTTDVTAGRWAIADGALDISTDVFNSHNEQWKQELLQKEDGWKKGIIEKLASRSATLAVWEMKSLTVGTPEVMEEIVKMGVAHTKFSWKKCTLSVCEHRSWKGMEESRDDYDPGLDARSPPWTLPDVPLTSAVVNSRPIPLDHLRSASAQGGTTSTSYKESLSSVEDGEGIAKKRNRDSDAPEYEQPALKKSKVRLMYEQDEFYEPPPDFRKEATAQSFLQQVT